VWVDFNRRMESSRGDVGVWQETYIVKGSHCGTLNSGIASACDAKVGKLVSRYRKRGARAPA